MALQWINPKSASYCCTPARHVPWSPQRCMARGRGEGRLWDMADKGSRALHGLGEQFLPDTQMSPTCWHSCQPWVHEWGRSWLTDVDPFGLRNTLVTRAVWPISHANSSLVVVPCPLSPPSWLEPSRLPPGKAVACATGEGTWPRFPIASKPLCPIKTRVGYTGKCSRVLTLGMCWRLKYSNSCIRWSTGQTNAGVNALSVGH